MSGKKLKCYEIRAPIKETWHFEVWATSKKDALQRYRDNDESLQQTCSTGGSTRSGRLEIDELKDRGTIEDDNGQNTGQN